MTKSEPTERDIIIATVRGTLQERRNLLAAASREGMSLNQFLRVRLGMCVRDRRAKKGS